MTSRSTARTEDSFMPAWLDEAVALPSFEVIDTRSAQGRLDNQRKTMTIRDLVLFHGHACDGLLRGAYALRALADVAFPGRAFDRSDLLVVSKNSPCLGDVAACLTGGRARFGTHRLDESLGVGYIVQVISTGETWQVREEPGFFPALISTWEAALLEDDRFDPADKAEFVAINETAQWNWLRSALLPSRPSEHYQVQAVHGLAPPPALHGARRTDVVNRSIRPPRVFASPYESEQQTPRPSALLETTGPFEQRYLDGVQ